MWRAGAASGLGPGMPRAPRSATPGITQASDSATHDSARLRLMRTRAVCFGFQRASPCMRNHAAAARSASCRAPDSARKSALPSGVARRANRYR